MRKRDTAPTGEGGMTTLGASRGRRCPGRGEVLVGQW